MRSDAWLRYASLLGLPTLLAFWRQEFIAFAPFLALGGLRSERRWLRILSRVGLVGFLATGMVVVRLLRL